MTEAKEILNQYLENKSRIRITDLKEAKRLGERWAMLTSYDATSAKIFDVAKIPCLLIGDSAAQVVYGYESTLPVTMDELIPLARGVASSCARALVIADLPFGSYQKSPEDALDNATRFMKEARVHGVKLEGGEEYKNHIRLLNQSGIPVMAHVGFTPQSEHALGGIKIQGRDSIAINKIRADALALQEAGAFACVLEMIPSEVGQLVTRELSIPTIGIGAGPHCDAQVLVWNDMAGFIKPKSKVGGYLSNLNQPSCGEANSVLSKLNNNNESACLELGRVPKFVKKYANMSEILYEAARSYANDVKLGIYPAIEHCYK